MACLVPLINKLNSNKLFNCYNFYLFFKHVLTFPKSSHLFLFVFMALPLEWSLEVFDEILEAGFYCLHGHIGRGDVFFITKAIKLPKGEANNC